MKKTVKMVEGGTACGSIAEELFDAIRLRDYCEYIPKLNKADIMSPSEFAASSYSQLYDLDTRICYHDKRINRDHVYDIFSDFSRTDASTAKVDMLSEISENYDWYESRGRVVLNFQGRTLASWLSFHLERKSARADKLALYALSHLYNRHTLVFGKNRPWCTIRATGDPKESDFPNSCQVHLLYIGVNIFAPLKPKTETPLDFTQGYLQESDINWARAPEMNYAAYFQEEEYSDFVEVINETPGAKKRRGRCPSHTHRAMHQTNSSEPIPPEYWLSTPNKIPTSASYTASSVDQPVFPGPMNEYSITYEFDPVNRTSVNNDGDDNIEHIVTISKGKGTAQSAVSSQSTNMALLMTEPTVSVNAQPDPADKTYEEQRTPTMENKTRMTISNNETVGKGEPTIILNVSSPSHTPDSTPTSHNLDAPKGGAPGDGETNNVMVNNNDSQMEPEGHYMLDQNKDCFISLRRLSQETVDKYTCKLSMQRPETELSSSDLNTEDSDGQARMKLRERPSVSRKRPQCAAAKNMDYSKMDIGSEPEEETVKHVPKLHPRLGPSKSRLRAQHMIKNQKENPNTTGSNTDSDLGADQSNTPSTTEKESGNDSAYQGDNEQDDPDVNELAKPKGKLTTKEHGLVKRPKKTRKFKCKICDNIFDSTKEWNRHYESSHPQLPCEYCGKLFRNPTSLYCHRYPHTKKEGVYPCEKCDEVFPFLSQLRSHMFSHRKISHFPCTFSGCKKTFKTEWNRTTHEKGHRNETMQCPHCDYSTKDSCYMKQHSRVHEDTYKYECAVCGKGFRFYEQMKRHRTKPCVKPTDSEEY